VTLHAFTCQLDSGTPRPIEVDDLRWVSVDELDDFPMSKLDRLISQELQQMHGRKP
jgi:A/G-specific adenine glycosylase